MNGNDAADMPPKEENGFLGKLCNVAVCLCILLIVSSIITGGFAVSECATELRELNGHLAVIAQEQREQTAMLGMCASAISFQQGASNTEFFHTDDGKRVSDIKARAISVTPFRKIFGGKEGETPLLVLALAHSSTVSNALDRINSESEAK